LFWVLVLLLLFCFDFAIFIACSPIFTFN
jgi:hypothetical protein